MFHRVVPPDILFGPGKGAMELITAVVEALPAKGSKDAIAVVKGGAFDGQRAILKLDRIGTLRIVRDPKAADTLYKNLKFYPSNREVGRVKEGEEIAVFQIFRRGKVPTSKIGGWTSLNRAKEVVAELDAAAARRASLMERFAALKRLKFPGAFSTPRFTRIFVGDGEAKAADFESGWYPYDAAFADLPDTKLLNLSGSESVLEVNTDGRVIMKDYYDCAHRFEEREVYGGLMRGAEPGYYAWNPGTTKWDRVSEVILHVNGAARRTENAKFVGLQRPSGEAVMFYKSLREGSGHLVQRWFYLRPVKPEDYATLSVFKRFGQSIPFNAGDKREESTVAAL